MPRGNTVIPAAGLQSSYARAVVPVDRLSSMQGGSEAYKRLHPAVCITNASLLYICTHNLIIFVPAVVPVASLSSMRRCLQTCGRLHPTKSHFHPDR